LEKLVLIDGSSYLYRAFHALPPLQTSRGEPSGAIYGVVNMLHKLLKEQAPTAVGVVFDTPTPTFRHKLYPAYKANRTEMPAELQVQIPPLQAIIQAMGLPLIIIPGVEADDVIASLARKAVEQGLSVLISTGDKDFAQIVTAHISLVNTMTGSCLDRAGVIERFGVPPEQIVAYLSLIGDNVDNIPGIPKVGPKTAVKWLQQYGTLDNIIAHADEIGGKVGDNLRGNLQHLKLAEQLITIQQSIPLPLQCQDLQRTAPDWPALSHWFKQLEFNIGLREWNVNFQTVKSAITLDYQLILTQEDCLQWLKSMREAEWISLDIESTSLDTLTAELVGLAFALPSGAAAYLPVAHDYPDVPLQLSRDWVLSQLKPLLEDPLKKKIGHNLKYDRGILANYGIELAGLYADTMLESYLLNSASGRHNLDTLALQILNHSPIRFESLVGTGKQAVCFNQVALEKAAPYAVEDVKICGALHQHFEPQLRAIGILKIRDQLEMPLLSILSRMERKGVLVDVCLLQQQSQYLAQRLQKLESESWALAGQEFNLSSPKQLQSVLFEAHSLPVSTKTATGQASTAEAVLQTLAVDHSLPRLILEHRSLSKLKSTYTEALARQIHPKTGRIHTSYHQAVVATGRLSSSKPNLQNIPIRTPEGRKIRQAFIAPAGYTMLTADYSQIELRIMAHLSQDEGLIEAFHHGKDIHAATAAELFGVPLDQVDSAQRRRAKIVNFGLIYGISAFGLATQLAIKPDAAQAIIDRYFSRYPGVKQYMEHTRKLAKTQTYVTTLMGRRLSLPSIHSDKLQQKQTSMRAAINAPLQGTAADIIKQAMITIDKALRQQSIAADMIMQVHDELVFEVKDAAIEQAIACIEKGMREAATLCIPLTVSIGVGSNWDEAH
jgi:DNA polymerase I